MKFIVIAAQRTGSSHFVNLLSAHPDVLCHGNVFKGNSAPPMLWPVAAHVKDEEQTQTKEALRQLRSRDPQQFLHDVFATGHGRACVGFKIFWNQNNDILENLLADPEVRKVVLFRSNVLANYASSRTATKTGMWSASAGKEPPRTDKISFSESAFLKFHDKYIGFYRRIFATMVDKGSQFHLITYDQINDPTMLAGVINFIGADPNKPISQDEQPRKQVKQGSSDILSRFSNSKNARKFLKQRDLSHWRREGEVSLAYLSEAPQIDGTTEED